MALKIAIVGRPNVGKSTLFNRLAGKKLAIVDDMPGVTRDRRFGMGRLGDLDLELIDTAGFEDVTDESLEARMRAQTELAVDEADLSLFIIDAREGVTPGDEIFAEVLRRKGKPVVVGANKSESKASESGVLEAFGLGLGEPIPISAEHGEGMADLVEALSALVPDEGDDEDAAGKPISIAIVGRPNAGKSTLVNALIGEEKFKTRDVRAADSRGRHTTRHRQLILLPEGHGLLVDTPGMRELQLWTQAEGARETFEDVVELAAGCHFTDCRHRDEPRCAVKQAVEDGTLAADRLEGFLKLQDERQSLDVRKSVRAQIDEKRKVKSINQSLKKLYKSRDR